MRVVWFSSLRSTGAVLPELGIVTVVEVQLKLVMWCDGGDSHVGVCGLQQRYQCLALWSATIKRTTAGTASADRKEVVGSGVLV